jgi:hypothetical protein
MNTENEIDIDNEKSIEERIETLESCVMQQYEIMDLIRDNYVSKAEIALYVAIGSLCLAVVALGIRLFLILQ